MQPGKCSWKRNSCSNPRLSFTIQGNLNACTLRFNTNNTPKCINTVLLASRRFANHDVSYQHGDRRIHDCWKTLRISSPRTSSSPLSPSVKSSSAHHGNRSLTSVSIFLNSESSSSTSKYSSVDVTEIIPGATIPGAINFPFVLMFTGPGGTRSRCSSSMLQFRRYDMQTARHASLGNETERNETKRKI